MRRATQIYLDDRQQKALSEHARRLGRSRAHVIRDLIDEHIIGEGPPPTDLRAVIGILRTGEPTDIGRDKDAMLTEAVHYLRGR